MQPYIPVSPIVFGPIGIINGPLMVELGAEGVIHTVFGDQRMKSFIPTIEKRNRDGSEYEQAEAARREQRNRPAFLVEGKADDRGQGQQQSCQKPQLLADGIAVQGEVVEHAMYYNYEVQRYKKTPSKI